MLRYNEMKGPHHGNATPLRLLDRTLPASKIAQIGYALKARPFLLYSRPERLVTWDPCYD